SKWHNLQRRKGAQDAKEGKIFMRHAKFIYPAANEGGGDPDMNADLRPARVKAEAENLPTERIHRRHRRATGTEEGGSVEEVTEEGYGPRGTAVIVHTLTDKRNRTASEVRHAFTKYGGKLGETGCVSFMFDRKGIIVIIDENEELDEEE